MSLFSGIKKGLNKMVYGFPKNPLKALFLLSK